MIRDKKYKLCRRVGDRILPQCQTPRFSTSIAKKQMGKRQGPRTDYGIQLLEKQKVRFAYGVSERQFSNYVKEARARGGNQVNLKLYELMETRLDNVLYRLGFATSRAFARQLVSHGHVTVNGVRVTVPSYRVKKGDVVTPRAGSRGNSVFANLGEKLKEHKTPAWLSFNEKTLEATVSALPEYKEGTEGSFNLNAIVEFYSRS